jgi:hypothetical protein
MRINTSDRFAGWERHDSIGGLAYNPMTGKSYPTAIKPSTMVSKQDNQGQGFKLKL